MQKKYQNERKLKDVHSRNNLPKVKDGAYIINLDEYKSIGTHWIVITKEHLTMQYILIALELNVLQKKLGNKNITPVIYRIQEYGSIMCRCFRIGFINFMLKGKTFLDCTSLVSPNDY